MYHIKHIISLSLVGSPDLYHAVRAGFVTQGTSFNQWCIANNVKRQTAEKALKGERCGKTSQALIRRILRDAGVDGLECS